MELSTRAKVFTGVFTLAVLAATYACSGDDPRNDPERGVCFDSDGSRVRAERSDDGTRLECP